MPCVAFVRDGALARLLVDFLGTLGAHRFSLIMLAEGQRSIDEDWQIIAAHELFAQGFAELARHAYTAGWGRWELVELDHAARTAVFRVHNSWEGAVQRTMGINYGVGLVAGKFAGYCGRLFGVTCWPRQTAFLAEGQPYDEIVVEPSERAVEEELRALAGAGTAINSDLHRLLTELRGATVARDRALAERDRAVSQQREQCKQLERQRSSIRTLSAPIVRLWDTVLAVPLLDGLDDDRAADLMSRLLPVLLATRARFVIVDLSGLWALDGAVAANLVRIGGSTQQLGSRCLVSGVGPTAAQALADLAPDLAHFVTHSSLHEALKACIDAGAQDHG